MHKHSSNGLARTFFTLLLMATALARAAEHEGADRGADEPDGYRWGLGLGIGVKKSPYAGVSTKTSALPLVSFENKYVRLFGAQLDAKLPSYGPFDFSLRTQLAIGQGYKASDSAQLAGMAERKGAIFVGAASTWRNEIADVSLAWLKDVSGNSKGSQIKLGADHAFQFERRFEVEPHAEIVHFDRKFIDYYDGVRPQEATAARPEYHGVASTETQVGVRFGYLFTPHQRLLVDVSDTHLGGGITDSPIVGRQWTPEAKIGYLYAF